MIWPVEMKDSGQVARQRENEGRIGQYSVLSKTSCLLFCIDSIHVWNAWRRNEAFKKGRGAWILAYPGKHNVEESREAVDEASALGSEGGNVDGLLEVVNGGMRTLDTGEDHDEHD